MFCVYIVYSRSLDVYYKGFTENVDRRLVEHLLGKSDYTSKSNDWKLVYVKEFLHKKDALIEEKRIKKLNRYSILKLIDG